MTPFIVISGFGDDRLRDSVERIDGAAMLDKPFALEELLAVAASLLDRDQDGDAAP
jgi:hypothetical protein